MIETNVAALEKLKAVAESAYQKWRKDATNLQEWWEAIDQFYRLAFPGGLGHGLKSLAANDLNAIESAVCVLEVDPWFFRSGYIKAELVKQLSRVPLSDDQRGRLRSVILQRIRGRDIREFRSYCRLAPIVADQMFVQAVADLAASSEPLASRHAGWVLTYLHPAKDPGVDRKT